jgi:hypothetical protein
MRQLIVIVILAIIGWQGYAKYQSSRVAARTSPSVAESAASSGSGVASSGFRCDGRVYCSQMTSCAEATFFLKNCPGTKMDGNNDGVPCEKQWCR